MTMFFAAVLAGLLVIEWWRQSAIARITAAALVIIAFSFAQPLAGRAMRQVINLPREQRVLAVENWHPLSDYQSGVLTMLRAVNQDVDLDGHTRFLCVGVLVWLSLSPLLRRRVALGHSVEDRRPAA
jgi:hypothetical protein